MMRVLMLKTAAGPAGAFKEGLEYDLPEEMARAYIAVGSAEVVERRDPSKERVGMTDGAVGMTEAVPVVEIDGIGPTRAEQLADLGIETVAELAAADAGEVAEALAAVSVGTAMEWITAAQALGR